MNQITIETEIPVSVQEIAIRLGQNGYPETISDLLADEPKTAEEIVYGKAKEYIRHRMAIITIKSLEFAYVDRTNWKYGIAYFTAVLSGMPGELTKVVGDGKFFLRVDR